MVRVAEVSPDCLTYPAENDFLLYATSKITFPFRQEDTISIPGFDGQIWAPLNELNRGVVRVIEPAGSQTKYVLLWDGATGGVTPDELIPRLFARS